MPHVGSYGRAARIVIAISASSCTLLPFNSETATATTAAELVTVRKDDLVDILRQWPEIMAELTIEAERHFQQVKASQQYPTNPLCFLKSAGLGTVRVCC